jgi:hypothetical protein
MNTNRFWNPATTELIPMSQEATTNLFSSNAEAVITRPVDLEEQGRRAGAQRREEDLSIEEFYEIEETSTQIRENGFKRVIIRQSIPF